MFGLVGDWRECWPFWLGICCECACLKVCLIGLNYCVRLSFISIVYLLFVMLLTCFTVWFGFNSVDIWVSYGMACYDV